MATQHVSTWRDEHDDMTYIYVPYNPTGAVTTAGGNMVIDMSKSNSSVYAYERPVSTTNSNITQTTTNSSAAQIYGGTGTTGSGETSQSVIQSFTATSNNIYAIGVNFNVKAGTITDGLMLTVSDAMTGGNVLGTKTLAASSIAVGETVFVFGNVAVTPGNTYYFELSRTGARDTTNYFGVDYNGASTYAGGGLFRRSEGATVPAGASADARFRVMGVDTFDMTGGKEFFWEVDVANSTITANKILNSCVIELFDKVNGLYSQTYSSALTVNTTDVYWRMTFGASVVLLSSSNNTTWTTRWTGPSLNANTLQGVLLRRSWSSTITTDSLKIKYFSYGTQQTVATQGMKYWNGTAWVAKPVKYWNGTAWVQKPVKHWDGTAWVTPTY